jgi:hypothetical protein
MLKSRDKICSYAKGMTCFWLLDVILKVEPGSPALAIETSGTCLGKLEGANRGLSDLQVLPQDPGTIRSPLTMQAVFSGICASNFDVIPLSLPNR